MGGGRGVGAWLPISWPLFSPLLDALAAVRVMEWTSSRCYHREGINYKSPVGVYSWGGVRGEEG